MNHEPAHLGALKIKQDLLQLRRIHPELNKETGWGQAGWDFQQITEIVHRKNFPIFNYANVFEAVLKISQDVIEDVISDTNLEIEGTVQRKVAEIIKKRNYNELMEFDTYVALIHIGGDVGERVNKIFSNAYLELKLKPI